MDEQNNVPQPEEGANVSEQAAQPAAATETAAGAAATQPMDQSATQPAAAQPAMAPTQAMPVATQPAAPQAGAQPGVAPAATQPMPQPNAAYNAAPGAYPPPKPTGALVCGILSIVFASIVGLILGIIAIVQSNKYTKAGGTEGTAKAAKICGIVGIVLSVISTIAIICSIAFGIAALNEYSTNSLYSSASTSAYQSSSATSATASEEDEEAVFAVVSPELQQLKDQDPAMMNSVGAIIEESLNSELASLDITLADLNLTGLQLAQAMVVGFDYEPDFVDFSTSGNTADAYYSVTVKDADEVSELLEDSLDEDTIVSAATSGSMEQVYALIGQALLEAIQNTPATSDGIFAVDLSKSAGTWAIDQESWDDEMEYFFRL